MNQFLNRRFNEWNSGRGSQSYNMFVSSELYGYLITPLLWDTAASFLAPRFNETSSEPPRSIDVPSSFSAGYWWVNNYTAVATTYVPIFFYLFSFSSITNSHTSFRCNRCADVIDIDPNIVTTERVFEEAIRQARTGWPLSASFVGKAPEYSCHRYTSRSVERYLGPWNVQPKNVVLVIGNQGKNEPIVYETRSLIFSSCTVNSADPKTPFRNSQVVTQLLGGKARLVQQAGYGHTSGK
jgi:hypothetical protein